MDDIRKRPRSQSLMDPHDLRMAYEHLNSYGRLHVRQWSQDLIDQLKKKEAQRRDAISFESKDALYIRMLAGVKICTKPELAPDRRRGSLHDSELKILESLEQGSHHRSKYGLKFFSLHNTRRKRRSVLKSSLENASFLDDHYGGQAKCLLSTVGEWNFSIFNLDKLTNGRPLFHISLHLFQEYNLIEIFQLDIVKLMKCFTLIEEGYHSNNPYHNAVHAADVTQAMHCYLQENKIKQCLSPLETMIALLSAITHDLDHPGVNQTFLIATSNHLAHLYKNSSVLENHHCRSAVGVLRQSGVFDHLDIEIWHSIEWQLKSLILATDITRQQEFLSRFRRHLDQDDLDLNNDEHRHFILQITLKCADICNPCRPWEISKRWSEQVCEEFFAQGDFERKLEIAVTPLCDRYNTTVAKIQSGFMQFVVLPLFQEWQQFNPTTLSQMMVRNTHTNKASWDGVIQEVEVEKHHQKEEPVRPAPDSSDEENTHPDFEAKENIDINQSDENDSCDELIPLSEKIELVGCQKRRHSLPPPSISRDLNILTARKESFPVISIRRRHSLPQASLFQSTSPDQISDKLSSLSELSPSNGKRTITLENILSESDISNLGHQPIQREQVYLAQRTSVAHRMAGGRPALASIRLPTTSQHTGPRDSSYSTSAHDNTEFTSCTFHSISGNNNRTLSANSGGRQVLRPISTNTRVPPVSRGIPARARSGSEDMGMFSAHARSLRMRFDRPRSLSFDTDSLPLLPSRSERRSFSGESGQSYESEEVSRLLSTSTAAYHEADESVTMVTNPVLELEEMLLTTPLLQEHQTITGSGIQMPEHGQ